MSADNTWPVVDQEYYDFIKHRVKLLLNLWFKIDAQGMESIPEKGPVLVATKHSHIIDPAVICAVINRKIYGVSKDANLKIPWLGPRLERMGMYPINRDNLTRSNVRDLVSLLEQGEALGYAPEMSRFPEGVARPYPLLSHHVERQKNKGRWEGDKVTHVLLGIDYSSKPWWRPRAKIIVKAEKFDVSSYENLDDLAQAMGLGLAVLSGLEYMPEEYNYYDKYADRLSYGKTGLKS
jgi:1-acyl-sn-glycerol-3-phosphate acyltransferase